jgi:hypothetical protein
VREVRRGFIPTYRGSRAERDQAAGDSTPGGAASALLLEDGTGLLLESGDFILLEA